MCAVRVRWAATSACSSRIRSCCAVASCRRCAMTCVRLNSCVSLSAHSAMRSLGTSPSALVPKSGVQSSASASEAAAAATSTATSALRDGIKKNGHRRFPSQAQAEARAGFQHKPKLIPGLRQIAEFVQKVSPFLLDTAATMRQSCLPFRSTSGASRRAAHPQTALQGLGCAGCVCPHPHPSLDHKTAAAGRGRGRRARRQQDARPLLAAAQFVHGFLASDQAGAPRPRAVPHQEDRAHPQDCGRLHPAHVLPALRHHRPRRRRDLRLHRRGLAPGLDGGRDSPSCRRARSPPRDPGRQCFGSASFSALAGSFP
eukprot:m.63394 g.63394  ORF g.63394 m.63394 type:complete len:314 (-) comp7456_c0_seq1:2309-3250(-)